MNRMEFMAELERLLADMPEEERQAAVQYYADYFATPGRKRKRMYSGNWEAPERWPSRSNRTTMERSSMNQNLTRKIVWKSMGRLRL